MPELLSVCAHTSANLAAAGAGSIFLSDPLQVGLEAIQRQFQGFAAYNGFFNCDQNCTIDIYQGFNFADINAVAAAVPAAGAGNGLLRHRTIAFAGAAAGDGIDLLGAVTAPWIRIRITNTGGVPTTQLRLHFGVVE